MATSTAGYGKHFSDASFWQKCRGALRSAGAEVLLLALKLYYALKRPETPLWAKTAILGALGYFVCPIDLIPDAIPVIGFSDDLGVLLAAVGAVSQYIDAEVERLATAKLRDWGLA
jgi:uncharacterized membrane protein YkvA (DUF1232 family)